jgi:hypothetical protein
MKLFRYTVSTCTIWTSFDYGEVEAEDHKQARELAKKELDKNFETANKCLEACGLSVYYAPSQIEVEEKIN